ncbi:DNA-binding protein [Musa troglodytarum]|uniref:DNA-binding protein n=1 Tax=Musa troglodytarum TaxID=320322 RepID=A0A9E7FCW7_9LILI|nr:DNA-binding protein [Musa troglodytarum]
MDRAGPTRPSVAQRQLKPRLWTRVHRAGKSPPFWWHSLVFPSDLPARGGCPRDRESGTEGRLVRSASMDEQFSDAAGDVIKEETTRGLNPGLVVLLVVGGLLLLFLLGNYVLYMYAQKTLPPRRKKPISKKKLKRERLKQGVSAPGE